jgi:putative ATP-binding cassette transporter
MRSWRLVAFLLTHARGTLWLLVAMGLAAGLFSAGLLALIARVLTAADAPMPWLLAAGFAVLALGKIGATLLAQLSLARFTQGAILELSLTLARKVLGAPLRVLERRGGGHILTTMTDDVGALTWAVQCVPQFAMHGAVVLGCGIYLAWLSWPLFAAMAIAVAAGACVYWWQHTRAFEVIHRARRERSQLFEHFRSLTLGLKELMLHRARRQQFLADDVHAAADAYRRSNMSATVRYALADAWVQLLYHALIAIVLFAAPLALRSSPEVMTGYVFGMLYLMPPLWSIIGMVPTVARGQAALMAIEQLGVALDNSAEPCDATRAPPRLQPARITLRELCFRYDDAAGAAGFHLGPIDLTLQPGELLFVVGGNGSGKSTFVKLLCGLYAPTSGELLVDGKRVCNEQHSAYRELFSVVFSDFHLFQTLHGVEAERLQEAGRYLRELQLDVKVTLQGTRFSTIDLSQGQRKRLALVTTYLEDRPIVVFDEWAADQDPEYKRIFYARLVPELRARGKTVVVITHDDRYFHLGDRVLKLEDGQVVSLGPSLAG